MTFPIYGSDSSSSANMHREEKERMEVRRRSDTSLAVKLIIGFILIFAATYLFASRPPTTLFRSAASHSGTGADHTADTPTHPLDPLTVQELRRVQATLAGHRLFRGSGGYTLHTMALEEPPKRRVLRWREGDPLPPRRAHVVVRVDGETLVLVVDIGTGQVFRRATSPGGGYPMLTIEDMTATAVAPLSNDEFKRSVERRGVDIKDVTCLPIAPGWFGKGEENRRLIKAQCFSSKDTTNFYMRPIEGVTALVDIDSKEVLQVTDRGRGIPVPPATNTEYRYSKLPRKKNAATNINPISLEQLKGPSFTISGHKVTWANWEFHVRPDARAGAIFSVVKVRDPDSGEPRSVMYKGMTSELFVPYMDPTDAWYFKTYLDAGEYGFGLQAMPLEPLNDCPRNAEYMDAVFAASDGTPYVRERMICVFERYAGDVGWRHTESPITGMQIREVKPKVTLMVRMAASVGNYDYIMDWEFQNDGLVQIKAGLSGILMVKATPYTNMNQVSQNETLYGTLISDNLIGVVHDHYVTYYLDMDVDGPDNSFVKVHIEKQKTTPVESKSPRKTYLKATKKPLATEKEAQIKLKLYDPAEYHIINDRKTTNVGNPIGYKIVPHGNAASLLDSDDPPQKRAAFTENQIWVTPYNRSEERPAGLLVWQSHGEDTIATWSERDRSIANRDIVLWYTLGFHHVPCQEDFPIMPTVQSSFDLKPANFFDRNPILHIPSVEDKDLPVCNADASA